MYRGYVKLWRKSFESTVWDNPNVWRFWCWCLMKATHKEFKAMVGYQEVLLKPGEFIFGLHKCSKETGLSIQTIRTTLKSLNGKKLTRKVTNKYSIISVDNWDSYQMEDNGNNKQTNKRVTSKQQATNKQLTTYKNDKNDKNDKNTTKEYPFWLNQSHWFEYKKHRKEIKAPMTERAEKLAIAKLKRLIDSGNEQERIIEQSIEMGWKGLFDVKEPTGGKSEIKPTTYAQAQDAERRVMVKMIKEIRNDGESESDSGRDAQTSRLLSHDKKVD